MIYIYMCHSMFTPSMADMISACPRRAMDAHSNTCIFIFIQVHLSIVVGQFTQINQECQDPSRCYTLYRGSATWSQAASYCQSINQRLAVIPDQDTQDVISRFAGSGTGDDRLAWVGGRRGRGTPWRDVNDNLIGSSTIREVAGSGQWCSGVLVTSSTGDDGVYALPCQGSYRALCQLPSTSRCEAPRYNISRVCHVVSGSISTSWESARAHCRTVYGGKLAFSVISSGRLFDPNYPDDTYFWVGFHRRSWVWSSIQVLLTYTDWLPSEGVGELDECLVVDLTQNGAWRDTKCDVTHEYFICEGTLPIKPTTSSIDSTILLSSPQTTGRSEASTSLMSGSSTETSRGISITSVVFSTGDLSTITEPNETTTHNTNGSEYSSNTETPSVTITTTTVEELSTTENPHDGQSRLYHIIGGCSGALVLVIVCVIITVVRLRRRRKHRNSSRNTCDVGTQMRFSQMEHVEDIAMTTDNYSTYEEITTLPKNKNVSGHDAQRMAVSSDKTDNVLDVIKHEQHPYVDIHTTPGILRETRSTIVDIKRRQTMYPEPLPNANNAYVDIEIVAGSPYLKPDGRYEDVEIIIATGEGIAVGNIFNKDDARGPDDAHILSVPFSQSSNHNVDVDDSYITTTDAIGLACDRTTPATGARNGTG